MYVICSVLLALSESCDKGWIPAERYFPRGHLSPSPPLLPSFLPALSPPPLATLRAYWDDPVRPQATYTLTFLFVVFLPRRARRLLTLLDVLLFFSVSVFQRQQAIVSRARRRDAPRGSSQLLLLLFNAPADWLKKKEA